MSLYIFRLNTESNTDHCLNCGGEEHETCGILQTYLVVQSRGLPILNLYNHDVQNLCDECARALYDEQWKGLVEGSQKMKPTEELKNRPVVYVKCTCGAEFEFNQYHETENARHIVAQFLEYHKECCSR